VVTSSTVTDSIISVFIIFRSISLQGNSQAAVENYKGVCCRKTTLLLSFSFNSHLILFSFITIRKYITLVDILNCLDVILW